MAQRYNPKDIEPAWQSKWRESGIYQAKDFDERQKYVMLTEFPYPSGAGLHIGHVREYTLGDIMARHKRMQGFNVLYPMAFDAFGLPTENYAIKNKISPQKATADNIAVFRQQFESMGMGFDWTRSFSSTDPDYYKWTQWLFLQFYKEGLAYQADIAINWCPHCKTGLANEEVANGRHERCDTPVEKKQLKQWMLKITAYADRLIEGLKTVDYPARIADQQVNWIGRSIGAEITWQVCDHDGQETGQQLVTFTTRKDTIPGVTFIVIAPESPLLDAVTTDEHRGTVHAYRQKTAAKTDIARQEAKDKSGVPTGRYAKNPFNGKLVPIYAADYVLASYGTGVVMGMGGHDERDREFALKHGIESIFTTEVPAGYEDPNGMKIWNGAGTQINSGEGYDGLPNKEAGQKIFDKLKADGVAVERVNYKLRDWIFSRQHYWGEPIPVVHCPDHGAVAVPDDQLPVTLPPVDHYEPTDTGQSPLSEIEDWVNTVCPTCGGPAKRETDTMPNWAGSSWYYLRYFDARNDQRFAAEDKLAYWQNADLYLGGMEHTTLHLLYSRFWHQFFYDQGLVPTPEPYQARRGQGIIQAADGSKMSKSKGNVVNPTDVIDSGYGADALRVFIAFIAPYDQTTPWSPEGVAGAYRFLQRIWNLVHEAVATTEPAAETANDEQARPLLAATHKAIRKVSQDIDAMGFNTAVAALMEFVNELYRLKGDTLPLAKAPQQWRFAIERLLQLLAPFAPHISEELWALVQHDTSIHISQWPDYDESYLVQDVVEVAVQVNGKLRATIQMAAGADEPDVVAAAKADGRVVPWLEGKQVVKTIYVAGKIVNFVVR